jgi:DNA-binding transcriptional MerR regulator
MVDTPVDKVMVMRQQGYDNSQIVQILQRDGYTSAQVFDAINQVELRSGAPVAGNPTMPPHQQQQYLTEQQASIEEYVETIIDEKWTELEKDIQKIIDWKNRSEQRMNELSTQVADLKQRFEKLQDTVLGKVGEYDRTMQDVGADLKAMERVFSKVLPNFTENVKQLGEITERLRDTPPPAHRR